MAIICSMTCCQVRAVKCRVAVLQIDLGDLQIHRGLVRGLVFGVKQAQGVGLVLGAQAGLLAGGGVLAIITRRSVETG